ncbi:MAG TPA: polysaccharide deacetylase family protein [Candidatus Baltobacteraceae bacterium]|nr:polysaccharide deacetylase family protein [Candidatus Baltobacteraceae bacterium]
MRPSRWFAAAIVLIAAVSYAGYRLYVHERMVQPAVVTPHMDAQQAISPSLAGHLKRLINEHITYGNRSARPKLIALTFDDGPYPIFTPLLLEQLGRLHVHATFFLIGRDAEQWPQLAQRIEQAGNEIADHTYTHPNLDQETPEQVREEILRGRDVLYPLVHDPSVLSEFRPPHGRYTVTTVQVAQKLGYQTILWTDDSGDWRTVTPAALQAHLERYATAPEIALLHSGRLATIEMLPRVVAKFEAAGYRFVTVRQLLAKTTAAELNHPAKHPV